MKRIRIMRNRFGGFGKLSSHTRALLLMGVCAVLSPGLLFGQGTASQSVPDTLYENASRPNANDALDTTPWSIMAFRGWSNYHTLGRTVRFIWDGAGEDVYGLDVAYTISPTTGFGRFFDRYLAARFQVAGKVNARNQPTGVWISELSAYFALRWRRLPWNHIVATSFSMGEGLSVVSDVPEIEILTTEVGGTSRLLNYWMMEMTLAVPSLPYLQLVGRIHHRSGAFGLFGDAQESGSNTVGLGVRWHM
jgi:hypothetical protein